MPGDLAYGKRVYNWWGGHSRIFNPLLKPLYVVTTNWNLGFDTAAALDRTFDEDDGRTLTGGYMLVAVARKEGRPAPDG